MMIMTACASPEDAGVSSLAVGRLLDEFARRNLEVHAAVIVKDGRVAARFACAPYDTVTPHTLFSLSKSFCSCAVGFAVAEGRLTYDTPIAALLPDKLPENPSEALLNITVGDLLCMGSGMHPDSDRIPEGCTDFARYFLSRPVEYPPRTHFHYNTIGTYTVGYAVQRLTGQSLRDYLTPRLFDKIGIRPPQWDCCPGGANLGGYGLHLSCEDIARFGQLLLDDGMWQGERVLPAGWVRLATEKKIENRKDGAEYTPESDWQQGYGYQFWRTRGGRYRGDGMFGQICMVDEKHRVVVALTAGLRDMQSECDALHAFFQALELPMADAQGRAALLARLNALAYPFPADDGTGYPVRATYADGQGAYVRLEDNGDGTLCAHICQGNKAPFVMPLIFGVGYARAGELVTMVDGEQPQKTLCGCGWQKGELFCLMRTPGGPYTVKLRFTPLDGGKRAHIALDCVGPASGEYDMTMQAP